MTSQFENCYTPKCYRTAEEMNPFLVPDYQAQAREEMKRIREERSNKLLVEHLERFAPEKLNIGMKPFKITHLDHML